MTQAGLSGEPFGEDPTRKRRQDEEDREHVLKREGAEDEITNPENAVHRGNANAALRKQQDGSEDGNVDTYNAATFNDDTSKLSAQVMAVASLVNGVSLQQVNLIKTGKLKAGNFWRLGIDATQVEQKQKITFVVGEHEAQNVEGTHKNYPTMMVRIESYFELTLTCTHLFSEKHPEIIILSDVIEGILRTWSSHALPHGPQEPGDEHR